MKKYLIKILVVILASSILVSCAGTAPTEDVDLIMTDAVTTMVAAFFQTQTALVTPVTATSTSTLTPLPTVTLAPSFTPLSSPALAFYTATLGLLTPGTPTATGTLSTATINPGVLGVGCNNLYFIRDVTIPAGTVLQKNAAFTKTWKVQNTGTCDWLYQYSLVLSSGDYFGSKDRKIQKLVKVGDWSELSVGGITPNKAGTYTSYWRLSNGQSMFGATLALSFVVAEPPTSTPVPTSTNTETPTLTPTP